MRRIDARYALDDEILESEGEHPDAHERNADELAAPIMFVVGHREGAPKMKTAPS
jgi:hypothetical protein